MISLTTRFFPLTLAVAALVGALAPVAGAKSKTPSFPLWNGLLSKNATIDSYLFEPSAESYEVSPKGVEFVKDIVKVLHARQHPRKEKCRSSRLLVIQMSSTSFEGVGSILKQVMLGLSIAAHSNRTLVWGIGHPFMFEHTKEVWAGPYSSDVPINGKRLNCAQSDPAAGPFGCFFQPISTCSLADLTPSEILDFSHNAYNESARAMLGEIRKGVALYHPPFGLFDYIVAKGKGKYDWETDIAGKEATLWAAAVAAYTFRLKPDVVQLFRERYEQLFGSGQKLLSSSASASQQAETTWGVHVRHGDLKALSNVYGYKEVFEFEDYFHAAQLVSHKVQHTPDKLLVATDSVEADNLPQIFERFNKKSIMAAAARAGKNERDHGPHGVEPAKAAIRRHTVGGIDFYEDGLNQDDDDDDDVDMKVNDRRSQQSSTKASSGSSSRSSRNSAPSRRIEVADDDDDISYYCGEKKQAEGKMAGPNDDADFDEFEEFEADSEEEGEEEEDLDWIEFNSGKINVIGGSSASSSASASAASATWYNDPRIARRSNIPQILTINNTDRYRTPHGSHTVAANGGCLRDPKYSEKGMRCALNYEDILLYQGLEEHRSVPRAVRLMRVLYESIEDIYLLSFCDRIIAQGSSHFSTLAALLIWARTGAADVENGAVYLDAPSIEIGFTPTAYLHGMNLLNGTHAVDTTNPAAGKQRWAMHTNAFISGLDTQLVNDKDKFPYGDPWSDEMRMKMEGNFPQMPEKLFYWEAKTWLGASKGYKPTLPGHCPGRVKGSKRGTDLAQLAAVSINLGVDHLDKSHNGQAIQCWTDAIAMLESIPVKKRNEGNRNALDVAQGNMGTLRVMRYAEMVINENRDTNEFFQYQNKYMEKSYDGVSFDHIPGLAGSGIRPQGDSYGGPDGLKTLDDVQEEINRLEAKLTKLKEMRDKMYEVSKQFSLGGNLQDIEGVVQLNR